MKAALASRKGCAGMVVTFMGCKHKPSLVFRSLPGLQGYAWAGHRAHVSTYNFGVKGLHLTERCQILLPDCIHFREYTGQEDVLRFGICQTG